MKILVIAPISTEFYKDDTQMFIEGLKKYCSHEIVEVKMWEENGKILANRHITDDFFKGVDVIWAPYEPLIPYAIEFKEKYNIPVVGHFEIIPPHRIVLGLVELYWYQHTVAPDKDNKIFKNYNTYMRYIEDFLKCDVKSVTGAEVVYNIERLLGKNLNHLELHIKPYPLDNEYLESLRQEVKEKNQILFIDKLNEYKRIMHVLEAFKLIPNPPKLVIAGIGDLIDKVKDFIKENNLNAEVLGLIDDKDKVRLIQESLFLVEPMSVLTPNEAAYFKKPSICYDEHCIRERIGNMCVYAQANNIQDLSRVMKLLIDNPNITKTSGKIAYNMLMNGQTNSHRLDVACRILEEMFIKAVKK